MDCKACRNEIELAPTGEGARAEEALAHMERCARCRDFSAERHALVALVSSLEAISAPHDFEWRLRARLAADKRGTNVRSRSLTGFAPGAQAIALAATFALLIGVAVIFKQMSPESFNAKPAAEIAGGNARNVVETPNEAKAGLSETIASSSNNKITATDSLTSRRVRSASPARAAREVKETPAAETAAIRPPATVRSNDFSSSAAPVITLFAVPVKNQSQHLKLLLDAGHGTMRTVSLQPVTFGAQAILERQGGAAVQRSLNTNTDDIW
jgi:hypothetical protein